MRRVLQLCTYLSLPCVKGGEHLLYRFCSAPRKQKFSFIVINIKPVFFGTFHRRSKKEKRSFLGFYIAKTFPYSVNCDFPHFKYTSLSISVERFLIWLTAWRLIWRVSAISMSLYLYMYLYKITSLCRGVNIDRVSRRISFWQRSGV